MQNKHEIKSLSRNTQIKHYELRDVLDSDEFSLTYTAWDSKRYHLLTIKEYFPKKIATRELNTYSIMACEGYQDDYQEGLERFLDEAKILASFKHPNIVKVLDYFQLNNTAYQCMIPEQGQTLDKLLLQLDGKLPEQKLKHILKAILIVLQYTHERNFYHNNINLSNICIRTYGEPCLIEFDNAQLVTCTNSNDFSLEKISNEYSAWSDLYALGAVIYQCISEQVPVDILSRQKALAKDNIDPLIPATKAGNDYYTVEFLELIDWMLTPEQKEGPYSATMILAKLENGLTLNNTNTLQPAISKNEEEDDNNHYKNISISAPIAAPNNEKAIHTDNSTEISVLRHPVIPAHIPDSSSVYTILWIILASIIVMLLILIGLSLQQPLQQTLSNKNNTGHLVATKNTETLRLNTNKKHKTNDNFESSSQQQTASKQYSKITINSRDNAESKKIDKQNNVNLIHQKNIPEQQFETLAQIQIKPKSANKSQQPLVKDTVVSASQQIPSLLTKAKTDIEQLRLSTPRGNNALEKYKKILQLAPNNEQALQGLSHITEKYLQLVKSNLQKQNYGTARKYLDKAKIIQPKSAAIIEAELNLKTTESTYQHSQVNSSKKTKTPLEIEMVWISPGCFQMGDNEIYAYEHEVCLTRGYYLGKYEVTQSQWRHVMNNNPSVFKGNNKPVQNISWNEVQTFIRKLNEMTGKHYRLPTEAEWEYACRNGGKILKFCGSNNANRVAWYKDNSDSSIHPVGKKQPNRLGLYDMSGNVWEWVQDWYQSDYYNDSPIDNPKGPLEGTGHVVRGGSWFSSTGVLRSAYRVWYGPGIHVSYLGFRLAR